MAELKLLPGFITLERRIEYLEPGEKPPHGERVYRGKKGGSYYIVGEGAEKPEEEEEQAEEPKEEETPEEKRQHELEQHFKRQDEMRRKRQKAILPGLIFPESRKIAEEYPFKILHPSRTTQFENALSKVPPELVEEVDFSVLEDAFENSPAESKQWNFGGSSTANLSRYLVGLKYARSEKGAELMAKIVSRKDSDTRSYVLRGLGRAKELSNSDDEHYFARYFSQYFQARSVARQMDKEKAKMLEEDLFGKQLDNIKGVWTDKSTTWTKEHIEKVFDILPENHYKNLVQIRDQALFLAAGSYDKGLVNMNYSGLKSDDIELIGKKLYSDTMPVAMGVAILTHEVAHQVITDLEKEKPGEVFSWDELFRSSKRNPITEYAQTNTNEFFAETYMYYVHNPKVLKTVSPRAYELMKKVFEGQEYD